MRWLSLLVLVAACKDKLPDPPSASAFAAMTAQQQCDATAPRAVRCIDELMLAAVREMTGDAEAASIEKGWAEQPDLLPEQARYAHDGQCEQARHGRYMKAVVTCWNEPDCKRFASCVFAAKR